MSTQPLITRFLRPTSFTEMLFTSHNHKTYNETKKMDPAFKLFRKEKTLEKVNFSQKFSLLQDYWRISKMREQSPTWNEYELVGGVIGIEGFRKKIQ